MCNTPHSIKNVVSSTVQQPCAGNKDSIVKRFFEGHYWISRYTEGKAVSASIYIVLFSLNFFTIVGFFFFQIPTKHWAIKTLGLAMLVMLFFVYFDIHSIEAHKGYQKYSNWVNRQIEIILRVLILFSLIFGVGEVAHLLSPIVNYIKIPGIQNFLKNFLLDENIRTVGHSVFVKGSISAFFWLFVWNVGAISFRSAKSFKDKRWDWIAIGREGGYVVLSVMSLIFWVLFYHNSDVLPQYALLICLLFFFFYLFDMIMRVKTKWDLPEDVVRVRVFSNSEKTAWLQNISEVYKRLQSITENYTVNCEGLKLTVLPGVYAPQFFTDTQWFAKVVPKIVGNGSLLEIGTGTGIIAIKCAMNGARVVATDVNPIAVESAKLNNTIHEVSIDVREGDVYAPIEDDEKFDYVFWAHPFNNCDKPLTDMLLRSGFDFHYEGVRSYIVNARKHLTEKGRLLLGSGESADLQTICDISADNEYHMICLNEVEMPLATLGNERIRYMLLELLRN
ncbi:methyltransferase [Candidatus Latescibacterota bacterium]